RAEIDWRTCSCHRRAYGRPADVKLIVNAGVRATEYNINARSACAITTAAGYYVNVRQRAGCHCHAAGHKVSAASHTCGVRNIRASRRIPAKVEYSTRTRQCHSYKNAAG